MAVVRCCLYLSLLLWIVVVAAVVAVVVVVVVVVVFGGGGGGGGGVVVGVLLLSLLLPFLMGVVRAAGLLQCCLCAVRGVHSDFFVRHVSRVDPRLLRRVL